MKPNRYIPPRRPPQPSADDQALRRMTSKVKDALIAGFRNIATEYPHKKHGLGLIEKHDVEHLAVQAMTAYDDARRIEQAREELSDPLDDLLFS